MPSFRKVFLFLLFLIALLSVAERTLHAAPAPKAPFANGLMWRDSPLPATFPLVVKTPEGQDYLLRLQDPDNGHVVLAAGITGGAFFRVLVPPGDYLLDLAYGHNWDAATGAFADPAGALRITPALRFAVSGPDRKEGHVVTIGDTGKGLSVEVKGQALCQRATWVTPRPVFTDPDPDAPPRATTDLLFAPPELDLRTVVCD